MLCYRNCPNNVILFDPCQRPMGVLNRPILQVLQLKRLDQDGPAASEARPGALSHPGQLALTVKLLLRASDSCIYRETEMCLDFPWHGKLRRRESMGLSLLAVRPGEPSNWMVSSASSSRRLELGAYSELTFNLESNIP